MRTLRRVDPADVLSEATAALDGNRVTVYVVGDRLWGPPHASTPTRLYLQLDYSRSLYPGIAWAPVKIWREMIAEAPPLHSYYGSVVDPAGVRWFYEVAREESGPRARVVLEMVQHLVNDLLTVKH